MILESRLEAARARALQETTDHTLVHRVPKPHAFRGREVLVFTCNWRDGQQALQVAVQLLPALLHEVRALLLAEDALGGQAQMVGGQVPANGMHCKACKACNPQDYPKHGKRLQGGQEAATSVGPMLRLRHTCDWHAGQQGKHTGLRRSEGPDRSELLHWDLLLRQGLHSVTAWRARARV